MAAIMAVGVANTSVQGQKTTKIATARMIWPEMAQVSATAVRAMTTIQMAHRSAAGAEEVSYFIIDGEIAEIRFTLDGKSYLACANAQTGDFSGLYGQESDPETVDAATNAVLVSVNTDTAVYQKITWTDEKINYCLYGTDGADKDQVLAAYEALKK